MQFGRGGRSHPMFGQVGRLPRRESGQAKRLPQRNSDPWLNLLMDIFINAPLCISFEEFHKGRWQRMQVYGDTTEWQGEVMKKFC